MEAFFKVYGPIIFLGIPAAMYVGQAAWYAYVQGKIGLPIAFTAYMIGNIGFILDSKGI